MTNTSNNELQVPAPTADWQEEDWSKFRDWLVGMLQTGPVTVTFNKKDGTERVMNCSLQTELLPVQELKEGAKEKKENTNIIGVYDLDAQGWRSFVVKNVTNVTLKL